MFGNCFRLHPYGPWLPSRRHEPAAEACPASCGYRGMDPYGRASISRSFAHWAKPTRIYSVTRLRPSAGSPARPNTRSGSIRCASRHWRVRDRLLLLPPQPPANATKPSALFALAFLSTGQSPRRHRRGLARFAGTRDGTSSNYGTASELLTWPDRLELFGCRFSRPASRGLPDITCAGQANHQPQTPANLNPNRQNRGWMNCGMMT